MDENFPKIISIVYKLLDFFPDGDPLKIRAKEKVLEILENVTLISDANGWVSLQKERASAQLFDSIEVLESYLKLAKYQGWIENINFLIITKELDNIKNSVVLPRGAIRQILEIAATPHDSQVKRIDEGGHSKENLESSRESLKKIATVEKISEGISERQKRILEILTNSEKAQVSDIIKEIPNITKRTIRRDLDDLLKRGNIVRVGEWNQVFYRIFKEDHQGKEVIESEQNKENKTTIISEEITLVAVTHSINDLAQLFEYKEGTFANHYDPQLAEKIRNITIPKRITSIDELENTIKNSLTVGERALIDRHLKERMNELRNENKEKLLFGRTIKLS